MAISAVTQYRSFFAFAVISISLFCSSVFGYADQDDSTQVVAKALLCFDSKFIYESCDEAYRLNQSGKLNVPSEATDEYCNGPCLTETNLVLDCIDGILTNFEFYNKATIKDVRDTVYAGCSYGSKRGNFNVTSRIHGNSSHAHKASYSDSVYFGVFAFVVFVYRF